jgi:hypothetical protein
VVALAPAVLPADLFAAPDQEEMLRKLARPAEREPIPVDAQWQRDVAVVPLAMGGQVRCVLLPRAEAIELIQREREIVRRGTAEQQAAERERCRRDRLYFIGRWVDVETKFPIGKERSVPFALFPYQVRSIRLYDQARAERKGIFQDKSRQLGESWLMMALFLADLLFEEQWNGLVTHRKEVEVDDGGRGSTTKSLLGRLRFMYERLRSVAGWLAAELEIKHLLIRNPALGSFIVGEGSSPSIGRGATFKAWLADEWAHTEQSESAWASADEAVECPILNSTPEGTHNHFGRMHGALSDPKSDGDLQVRQRFLVNRVHWSENPIYSIGIERDAEGKLTSPYYRKATSTKTVEKAAQEYDINYSVSLPGRFYPEFAFGTHVPGEPIPLRHGWWYYLSADHGLADTEVWGLWQTDGRARLELVDEWHSVPAGMTTGANLTSAQVAVGVWNWLAGWDLDIWRMQAIIVDPAGGARDQTSGQSHHELIYATWLRMAGSGQRFPPDFTLADNSVSQGIDSVRSLLLGSYDGQPFELFFSPRAVLTIDSIQNYRRRVTSKGLVTADELQDWTNHAADMVRYMVHTVYPAIADAVAAATTPQPYTEAVSPRRASGHR